MDKREAYAIWLLPVGYVLGYRFLSQLVWKVLMAAGGVSATWMQLGGIGIGIACAVASALLCVYVHAKAIGPLPVGRAFLMGAIALPMLAIGHVFSSGVEGLTRYFTMFPMRATLGYLIVFLALPIVAAMWRRPMTTGAAVGDEAVADPAMAASTPEKDMGRAVLRVLVALISATAFLGWGFMFLFIVGMGGFGMTRRDPLVMATLASPLAVFAICFLASVGLFRPAILKITRPVVAVGMSPFLIYLAVNGTEGVLAAVAVLAFVGLYWAMCLRMEARP